MVQNRLLACWHWNPCCVSWHKEIYHKSCWTGKNGSYSKEKSITSWMRLGLNKSAAPISPLMENDSWYHHSWYQSNTQYSATFLGLSLLQEAIQKQEKMKCSNKALDVLCKYAKRYEWQTYTRLAACTACTASEVSIWKTTVLFSSSHVEKTRVSVSFSTKSTVPNISATTITRQNAKHKRVRRSGKTDLQILAIRLYPPKPRKP